MRLNASNAIYNVASSPIPAGGVADGYLLMTLSRRVFNEKGIGARIVIEFSDVKQSRHQMSYIVAESPDGKISYMPWMKVEANNDVD
jgi:hypothetical protein